jgi:predicted Zn-dependent protease
MSGTKQVNCDSDTAWDEALASAAASYPSLSGGGLLFLEERKDLVIEAHSRQGIRRIDQWSTRGLAVQGPFDNSPTLWVADPGPEDAQRLARAAVDPSSGDRTIAERRRSDQEPSGGETRTLELSAASRRIEALVSEAERMHAGIEARATWVGFEQRIRVARAHHAPIQDIRACQRIRLELRRVALTGEVSATGDALVEVDPRREIEDLGWLAQAVVRRLDERRYARRAPTGPQRIVFAPGVGGILIHELVGHALEGDIAAGGASWLTGPRREERCGTVELTVLDDPRRGRASWRFDDEGTAVRPVPLIREGRVTACLHDLRSAAHAGKSPTGHGRRSSYRDPVRPRMGCTFVAAGRFHPDEVMEDVSEGIYVRRMESASTDTATGRAVFKVTDADRIFRGRLSAPIKSHLLAVDARAALSSLERVSFDVAFDTCIGSCLRDGQPISTSVGGPTFRIGLSSVIG